MKTSRARKIFFTLPHDIEQKLNAQAKLLKIPLEEFYDLHSRLDWVFRDSASDISFTTGFYMYPSEVAARRAGINYCRTTGVASIELSYFDEKGKGWTEVYTVDGPKKEGAP